MSGTAFDSSPPARAEDIAYNSGRMHPAPDTFRQNAGSLAGLVAIAVLTVGPDIVGLRIVLVLLLCTLPGVLLLRALGIDAMAVARTPVLVPALSVLVLLGSGLAVNFVGPPLGALQPLRAGPLLVGVEAICGTLLLLAVRLRREPILCWRAFVDRVDLLAPLTVVGGAVAGAVSLNNGHPGVVAVLAAVGVVVSLVWGIWRAERWDSARSMMTLYSAGLAWLLSYSLRTEAVYGYDIVTEYFKAQQTAEAGGWAAKHYGDAYGAMLSITVLPAELQALTGFSVAVLFAVVYPALFALVPVGVFAIARRLMPARWAFVAGALLIVQRNFGQQLPGLARQEIALLLFVALVAVVVGVGARAGHSMVLVVLLGAGLVVTHYSTAYFSLGCLTIAALGGLTLFRHPTFRAVLYRLLAAVAALALGSVLWLGLITSSTSNVSGFAEQLRTDGLSLFGDRDPGQSLLSSLLTGNANQRLSAAEYQGDIARYYAEQRPYVRPLPESANPRYALRDAAAPPGNSAADTGFAIVGGVVSQVTYLAAAIAGMVLFFRRKTARSPALHATGVLALAAIGALAVVRLSGTVTTAYNADRALLQGLVVIAICAGWALHQVDQWLGARATALRGATMLAIAVTVGGANGLPPVVQGNAHTLNLANRGEDYDRFYVYRGEVLGAQWLGQHAEPRALVHADRYAQLRYLLDTGRTTGLLTDVTPQTIDRRAWVYLGRTNVETGTARSYLDGKNVLYRLPLVFLQDRYNLVYSNGDSAAYHR